MLYAVGLSVCGALGLSPPSALFTRVPRPPFLFDLADLHKARGTIPLAFSAAKARNPEQELRALSPP